MKNILKSFRKNNISDPPWGGFSLVRRGAEHFSKHPGTIKQRSCRNVKKMTSALWSFFESGVQNFCGRIIQDNIGTPPWDYYFLQNLPESKYPKYLAKLFYLNTGERLPLRHGIIDRKKLKTFNQKIQWLKLYGVTDLMRDCTDKVKVRDYVREKIGEEYLKPVLQIIPNESQQSPVIANHNSILGGEAIQRNLRKGETRVNEGIAYDSDSEVCDLPERQQIQRQEEVEKKTMNENSGIKPEFQNVDCHGTQNVIVPRLRFPKFQFRENRVLAEYNDGEPNDISTYFDKIDFDKLPDSFVIKTNHGCKWQYIIKNKEEFLNNHALFETVKKNITGWLEQDYSIWGGFEMQYRVKEKGIEPKILIEPFLKDKLDKVPREIEIYCFNGIPEIFTDVRYGKKREISYYNKKFDNIDLVLHPDGNNIIKKEKADYLINQTIERNFRRVELNRVNEPEVTGNPMERQNCDSNFKVKSRISMKEISRLSEELSKDFNFVRCDWLIYQNKLYFNELTFTPYSGFVKFNKKWNSKMGKLINIVSYGIC